MAPSLLASAQTKASQPAKAQKKKRKKKQQKSSHDKAESDQKEKLQKSPNVSKKEKKGCETEGAAAAEEKVDMSAWNDMFVHPLVMKGT